MQNRLIGESHEIKELISSKPDLAQTRERRTLIEVQRTARKKASQTGEPVMC